MRFRAFDRLAKTCAAAAAALAACGTAQAQDGTVAPALPVDVTGIVAEALEGAPLPEEAVALALEAAAAAEPPPAPPPVPPPAPPPAGPPQSGVEPRTAAPRPRTAAPARRYRPVARRYRAPAPAPSPAPAAPPPPPSAPAPAPAARTQAPPAGCAGAGAALHAACLLPKQVDANSLLEFVSRYQSALLRYQSDLPRDLLPVLAGQLVPLEHGPAGAVADLPALGEEIAAAVEAALLDPLLPGSARPEPPAAGRRAPPTARPAPEPPPGPGPGPPAKPQRGRGPGAGEPGRPAPAAAPAPVRGAAPARAARGDERAPPARERRAPPAAAERPPPPEPLASRGAPGASPPAGASAGPGGGGAAGAAATAALAFLFLLALADLLRRLRLELAQPRSEHVDSFPERPG